MTGRHALTSHERFAAYERGEDPHLDLINDLWEWENEYAVGAHPIRRETGRHRPETLQGFAIPAALFRLRADRAGEGTR